MIYLVSFRCYRYCGYYVTATAVIIRGAYLHKISYILNYLDQSPIVYEGEPLLLIELDNLVIEQDVREYIRRIDNPLPIPIERTVLLGPISSYFDRWPIAKINTRVPTDLCRFNRKSPLKKRVDKTDQNLI